MITEGIEAAVEHIAQELYNEGANGVAFNMDKFVAAREQELLALIRAEAINLADKLIGNDILLHSNHKPNDGELNPVEKAVFDYQVRQRIALAVYQNPPKGNTHDAVDIINAELSENEE